MVRCNNNNAHCATQFNDVIINARFSGSYNQSNELQVDSGIQVSVRHDPVRKSGQAKPDQPDRLLHP